MFQAEPILWLQSYGSPFVNMIMSTVSLLGYSIVYGVLIAIITFGINLRKGLSIFIILAIGGIMTDGLKRGLKFPRPSDIDIRITEPDHEATLHLTEVGSATSFWSLPSSEAMEAVCQQRYWSYGLPSGHVSAATAFLIGLFFFFRKRPIMIFSVFWILLMALSRMYLGRHYLADVIGGLLVGVTAVLIGVYLLKPLKVEDSVKPESKSFLRICIFVIPLLFLVPVFHLLDADNVGRLAGLVVTYFVITRIGQSTDAGKVWQRVARILLSVMAFYAIHFPIDFLIGDTRWEDTRVTMMLTTFLLSSIPFTLAFMVSRKLNLYQNNEFQFS